MATGDYYNYTNFFKDVYTEATPEILQARKWEYVSWSFDFENTPKEKSKEQIQIEEGWDPNSNKLMEIK